MRNIAVSILVTFAFRAYAEEKDLIPIVILADNEIDRKEASTGKSADEMGDELVDKLADKLIERARETFFPDHAELDDTTLGKGAVAGHMMQPRPILQSTPMHMMPPIRATPLSHQQDDCAEPDVWQQEPDLDPESVDARVMLRLKRFGRRNRPHYRITAGSNNCKRIIEYIGNYNPYTKVLQLKEERVKYWMGVGAQPSFTVNRLLGKAGLILDGKPA